MLSVMLRAHLAESGLARLNVGSGARCVLTAADGLGVNVKAAEVEADAVCSSAV